MGIADPDINKPRPVLALPPPAPNLHGSTGLRARLWLPESALAIRGEDRDWRLWLHLADGRIAVLRLLKEKSPNDALIPRLLAALGPDATGDLLDVTIARQVIFLVHHGAPASPLYVTKASGPVPADVLAFHAALDAEVLHVLAGLQRVGQFWASARNYNRLAAHPKRLERLQALTRFPLLVAPILLTRQREPNLWENRRYRYRHHDDAAVQAIEQGRDLAGALADLFGISKGLVRSVLCARTWARADYEYIERILVTLDALPPNKRPADATEIECFFDGFLALDDLLGEGALAQPELARVVFPRGWSKTWRDCARRFDNVPLALRDARDFLHAAAQRASALAGYRIRERRLAAGWLARLGLIRLLSASQRWHETADTDVEPNALPKQIRLAPIVGEYSEADARAIEILTYPELAREGQEMRHCVSSYWQECLEGTRIFSLRLASGERATAQYDPGEFGPDNEVSFRLNQLRGPSNAKVSPAMNEFARRIESLLNTPERAQARQKAMADAWRPDPVPEVPRTAPLLDVQTETELIRVLEFLGSGPAEVLGPEVLLCAPVAGYQFHAGPRLESRFAAGQPLTLAREPDNPHDHNAVRVEWQGEKLGYVSRREAEEIARLLDAGARLAARIRRVDRYTDPWERVILTVEEIR